MRQGLAVFAIFVAGLSLGALLTVGRDGTGGVPSAAQAQPARERQNPAQGYVVNPEARPLLRRPRESD